MGSAGMMSLMITKLSEDEGRLDMSSISCSELKIRAKTGARISASYSCRRPARQHLLFTEMDPEKCNQMGINKKKMHKAC